mgnify:CR=1 FL=1
MRQFLIKFQVGRLLAFGVQLLVKILDKSLKNQGLAALQIITINEKLYESYEKNKAIQYSET